ncbi:unnamed protein product [Ilex paraguariensis]|uniref:Uncharacterized protein n=1 Tax=Ilex paraguariensis TaxID=185542 RepID=A0ABC8S8I8_9AQUA
MEPLPGRNALVPPQPGEKVVNYLTRPVDTTTDFEGTTSLQPSQPASSGNAISGSMAGPHVMPSRSVPRPMPMVGMQRMQPQGLTGYNLSSQAGMGGQMNPGGIPMPRGVTAQAHQQQQKKRPRNGNYSIPSATEIEALLMRVYLHFTGCTCNHLRIHVHIRPFGLESKFGLPWLGSCKEMIEIHVQVWKPRVLQYLPGSRVEAIDIAALVSRC